MLKLSPPIPNQSQFRQKIRKIWNSNYGREYALILKTNDRFETVASLRTFATELGARAIILDIDQKLADEQIELLRRPGPRIVVITGIETMTPGDAKTLPDAINVGGHALPVIVCLEEASTEEAKEPALQIA